MTITLTSGVLTLNKNINIIGSSDGVRISGNGETNQFVVHPGVTATLDRLTLLNGSNTSDGGAIFNSGTLTITNSTLSNNSSASYGGAIGNVGSLTIIASTLNGNIADGGGGAIWTTGSIDQLIVANSTISGNTASADVGGGILASGLPIELLHVTITGNTSGV